MSKWHGGKGSGRRTDANDKAYADNWERIFGKKKPETKVRKTTPPHAKTKVQKDKTKYDRKSLDRTEISSIIDI